jgi:TPR repeat protein
MRELQGPERNSIGAARHLWQSVKNQNSSALIVLAGLYAKGDGVSKDCDQANVLLDAATRQAKSHAQFLRVEMTRADLRTSGCE